MEHRQERERSRNRASRIFHAHRKTKTEVDKSRGDDGNIPQGLDDAQLVHPTICRYKDDPRKCTRCKFICAKCRHFEAQCLIKVQSGPSRTNTVLARLHDTFQGLQRRSNDGCSICRLWLKAFYLSDRPHETFPGLQGERLLEISCCSPTLDGILLISGSFMLLPNSTPGVSNASETSLLNGIGFISSGPVLREG